MAHIVVQCRRWLLAAVYWSWTSLDVQSLKCIGQQRFQLGLQLPSPISQLPSPISQFPVVKSSAPPPTSLSCVYSVVGCLSLIHLISLDATHHDNKLVSEQIHVAALVAIASLCVSVWNLVQCPRLTEGSAFGWIGIDISCMASLEWQLFTYLTWQSIKNCRKHYRTVLDRKTALKSTFHSSLKYIPTYDNLTTDAWT